MLPYLFAIIYGETDSPKYNLLCLYLYIYANDSRDSVSRGYPSCQSHDMRVFCHLILGSALTVSQASGYARSGSFLDEKHVVHEIDQEEVHAWYFYDEAHD